MNKKKANNKNERGMTQNRHGSCHGTRYAELRTSSTAFRREISLSATGGESPAGAVGCAAALASAGLVTSGELLPALPALLKPSRTLSVAGFCGAAKHRADAHTYSPRISQLWCDK